MVIIAVDEDTRMLRQISELLTRHCEVLITTDPRKAMGWLESNSGVAGILVGEQVRGEAGVQMLKTARELRPEVRRVLITGYADLPVIVDGIHAGIIDRLLSKPLVPSELSAAVAMEPRTSMLASRPAAR